jgi:hypothetical protein
MNSRHYFRLCAFPAPISSHEKMKIVSSKISVFRRVKYDCSWCKLGIQWLCNLQLTVTELLLKTLLLTCYVSRIIVNLSVITLHASRLQSVIKNYRQKAKETWGDYKDTPRRVRPERVNKWHNSTLARWWWWDDDFDGDDDEITNVNNDLSQTVAKGTVSVMRTTPCILRTLHAFRLLLLLLRIIRYHIYAEYLQLYNWNKPLQIFRSYNLWQI